LGLMTFHTTAHRMIDFARRANTLADMAVTLAALQAGFDMTLVRKNHMIRHLIEPDPRDFFLFFVISENLLDFRLVRLPAAMAGIADFYAGDARGGILIEVFVTIGAIDPAIDGMGSMIERNRLRRSPCRSDRACNRYHTKN